MRVTIVTLLAVAAIAAGGYMLYKGINTVPAGFLIAGGIAVPVIAYLIKVISTLDRSVDHSFGEGKKNIPRSSAASSIVPEPVEGDKPLKMIILSPWRDVEENLVQALQSIEKNMVFEFLHFDPRNFAASKEKLIAERARSESVLVYYLEESSRFEFEKITELRQVIAMFGFNILVLHGVRENTQEQTPMIKHLLRTQEAPDNVEKLPVMSVIFEGRGSKKVVIDPSATRDALLKASKTLL